MKKAIIATLALMLATGLAATQSQDLSAGDVSQQDVTQGTTTDKWAMVYGSVTENVNLSDGTTEVFTWSETAPSGSAVLASETSNSFSGTVADLSAVSDLTTLTGVPTSGTDAISNTYVNSTELEVIDDSNPTAAADSDSSSDSAENLFVYDGGSGEPVWAGDVQPGTMINSNDYEVMVGQSSFSSSTTYDLYVEIN